MGCGSSSQITSIRALLYCISISSPRLFGETTMTKLLSVVLAAMLALSVGAAGQTNPATPWGFDLSGVDRTANPGDSFFDYAVGAWHGRTTMPADKARIGAFDTLRDESQEHVRAIIEDAGKSGAAPDTDLAKIGA